MSDVSIAWNRFGIGARVGDAAPADPHRWLVEQFARYRTRPDALASAATTAAVAQEFADYQQEQRDLRQQARVATPAAPAPANTVVPLTATPALAAPQPLPTDPRPAKPGRTDAQRTARQDIGRTERDHYAAAVAARANAALATDTPFVERLVWFWANHFAVSIDKLPVIGLAGAFEFEAIRPFVLGRFGDMLAAVERHPAMLLYLDQTVSVGPDSAFALRATQRAAARPGPPPRRVGLNENLAREIMELHTLGVRTGYTQADVTEFARALTGWTVAAIGGGPLAGRGDGTAPPGQFVFAEPLHQPGLRTIMGRRYPDGGVEQGQAVLADLAVHPATARHVATKLARHFAGDIPPPAMVARLQAAFLQSGGDLPTVYRALIASPEAWAPGTTKFRTPWEWTIATHRALGTRGVQAGAVVGLLNQLGQPTWKPGQPVGWDDIAGAWAAPDAVLRRVEAAERFAGRAPATIDARALAPQLFPGAIGARTTETLARADSPAQALALLLVSPEMMRR